MIEGFLEPLCKELICLELINNIILVSCFAVFSDLYLL